MFIKGSFYENTQTFEPNDEGETVFEGLRARKLDAPEPILEHNVNLKDRLDSVAYHYYAEGCAWRRIAEANPGVLFPEDLLFDPEPVDNDGRLIAEEGRERLGEVILIPRRKEVRR